MSPEDRAVLDARALRLAARSVDREQAASPVRVLVLGVADQRYGVLLESLIAVVAAPLLTPLPGLPPWMLGVLHHRGHLATAIDLAGWWLGRSPVVRPFVALVEGAPGVLGIFADVIEGFRDLHPTDLAPSLDEPGAPSFISSRSRDLLQIIDGEALFAAPELIVDLRVESIAGPRLPPPPRTHP